MAIPDFAQNVTAQSFAAGERAHATALAKATAANESPQAQADSKLSFGDLLDIVNPLQHIPIVSTIYRAITGDTEKPIAEVVGGALYGGLLGFGSALADVAFKDITGKDFGDTVLALFEGDNSSKTKVASADKAPMPVAVAPASIAVTPAQSATPGAAALLSAADAKGVNSALGQRALYAYRQSIGLTAPALDAQ